MKLSIVFPGQGSQALGMQAALAEEYPEIRETYDEASGELGFDLWELVQDGPPDGVHETVVNQPLMLTAGVAAWRAWHRAGGGTPAYLAGHSLGEYTALTCAGALPFVDAVQLVARRAELMQAAVPAGEGAMAAVLKLEQEQIDSALRTVGAESGAVVEVANLNSPGQTVISGSAEGVEAASTALKQLGGRVVPLKVSAPFHSSLMQPAAERLAVDLRATAFQQPGFAIVCNVTAEPLEDVARAPELLTQQVTGSVRWVECMRKLHDLGATRYMEFGSGNVLTGLVGRILDGAKASAVTDQASLASALEEVRS